ncbi:MAG: FAD-binding protein, partial [Pseudomonadota bacterium]
MIATQAMIAGHMSPKDEAEAADILREAHDTRTPLSVFGGNTRAGIGRTVEVQSSISSSNISGIVDYEPAEMVMIAKAGTPLIEIEEALAKGRQRMIFEPMDHRALLGSKGTPTVGAIAAGNISGPRRFVAGAARDSLLGARFVNGRGEVIKTGGRVMKNVTGLDLVKLMAGSWGTLGLLTEVTFKVVPLVETETTLVVHGQTAEQAAGAMAMAMATSNEVSGAAHVPATLSSSLEGFDRAVTCLRLEGFENSVALRAQNLKALLGGTGEISFLEGEASQKLWLAIRDCQPFADGTDDPVWRISTAPMNGHTIAAAFPDADA